MSAHGTAAEIAARFTKTIRDSEIFMAELEPYAAGLIEGHIETALADGKPSARPLPPRPTDDAKYREIVYIANDAPVRRLWQQHRIVYDIDPALWGALGDTDPDTVIPAGLMTRLPHPNPFIALPEPLMLPIDDKHRMQMRGFYVTGRTHQYGGGVLGRQVSTHASNVNGDLGLLIGAEVEDHQGRPYMVDKGWQDLVWTRVTLRTGEGETTVGQLMEQISSKFDNSRIAGQFAETVPNMVMRAVSALIYLCTTNAELRPLPASVNRRKAGKGTAKPPKVIQVGYITGAALRAWHRGESTDPGLKGKKKRPHVRRAHFHTYRVGPGRLDAVVKWLAPIPINVDAESTKTTVIPVQKVKS